MRDNTIDATKVIANAIGKRDGYDINWKVNLSMAFHDECQRSGITPQDLMQITDQAAVNFIKQTFNIDLSDIVHK